MNIGVSLWDKAKKIIPGGNQFLSKRSEMFLPNHWPSFYKKAKGVEVWDMDDVHYFDMSIMGIGTCVLGYANEAVNDAVKNAVDQGSMSTLNCYEEVQLAEKLIELHPWAHMARFARTGGEACAIAVRIARSFSQKDKILFCGYHGWHDWYISTNIADEKNLDRQLLSGLSSSGVPAALKNTAIPFSYGNYDEFESVVDSDKNSIGVIIMEVERHKKINKDFLIKVKNLASKIGAVVIFDEVSSGFRANIGGIHLLHDIHPDIVVLGKALGNGYPISAVIGTKEVMDSAQNTFISSSYWTERVGYSAALATIQQYELENIPLKITETGKYLFKKLNEIFISLNLNIAMVGLDSAPIMVINEENPNLIKTIFTQEMLKKGFLASTVIYVSLCHTKEIVDRYLYEAEKVFTKIAHEIRDNKLKQLLDGPICHSGFQRLS